MTSKLVWYHDLTLMTMVGLSSGISLFLLSFFLTKYWNKSIKKNEKVEFWWTFLPAVWLLFLSYPSLRNLFEMERGKPVSLVVKVIGHQWYWSYEYLVRFFTSSMDNNRGYQATTIWKKDENGIRVGKPNKVSLFRWGDLDYAWRPPKEFKNMKPFSFEYDSFMVDTGSLKSGEYRLLEVDHRLVLPLSSVLLSISSADVIHSWTIPAMSVKMDAVPGKHNIVLLEPSQCGVFYGQCSELCGVNHAFMPIVVEVISNSRFERWVAYMDWFFKGRPLRKPHWSSIFVKGGSVI
uniref:cytochrome c oxidase subunit II n=1 Tax=Pillucina pisidium (Dunker, 1860) TaxID=244488 RepID=UPI00233F0542|nr:cytochrome c oxidase subunit II [Pillucina pisidium (Dunker, 1860)]WBR65408.1 cytochrome c oxidase subunit 2 [Pillucina pisidium (Dunker, 1860)]